MKELLQQLIDKGFKSKTVNAKWTIDHYFIQATPAINDTEKLLLLEEIKAWFRNEHKILILPLFSFNDEGLYDVYIENIKAMRENENNVLISGIDFEPMLYKSYELALQAGIEQSEKLI